MKINFKVANVDYRLTSDKYQVTLHRVEKIKSGKNEGNESLVTIGNYPNEFVALKDLADVAPRESEVSTFCELAKLRNEVFNDIQSILEDYKFNKR